MHDEQFSTELESVWCGQLAGLVMRACANVAHARRPNSISCHNGQHEQVSLPPPALAPATNVTLHWRHWLHATHKRAYSAVHSFT